MLAVYGRGVRLAREVLEGAIFVSDVHHQEGLSHFPRLLNHLLASPPSQLFLMGDIFQILVGSVKSSYRPYISILEQLELLSQKSTLFYFEGNHDFGLPQLSYLKNIQIYPRKFQPIPFTCQDKLFLLAHGDLFLKWGYEIYIRLLSSQFSIKTLGFLDQIIPLYAPLTAPIYHKKIRSLIPNQEVFKDFSKQRLACYEHWRAKIAPTLNLGGVIEGHFHIGRFYKSDQNLLYAALPSFYHNQEICQYMGIKTGLQIRRLN